MAQDLTKKISAKIIMGDEKIGPRMIPQGETKVELFSIVGVAGGVKSGESNFGVWVALTGRFRAINLKTGGVTDSAKAFLPDVALDMIKGQLETGATGVEFAFTIGIKLSDKAACGYEYFACPLVEARGEDPLDRLTKAANIVPKLAAPQDEAELAASKAEKAKWKK